MQWCLDDINNVPIFMQVMWMSEENSYNNISKKKKKNCKQCIVLWIILTVLLKKKKLNVKHVPRDVATRWEDREVQFIMSGIQGGKR